MKKDGLKGVSVIICCYNSALRIQQTLEALSKQEYKQQTPWEIVLVDNNCNDGTPDIAEAIWASYGCEISFTIVKENQPGLGHARRCGVAAALYSIVIFCDDDNWLSPNYVQHVYELMQFDQSIGAYGGMGIPVFETEEPYWFYMFSEAYALGAQDIYGERDKIFNLYGAGLAVQKKLLQKFYESGFKPLLSGRIGKNLSSSEDTEITYAFVLMGYKLAYSGDLKFFHYLPKDRLQLEYLKKLFVAFGNDGPIRNLYYANISQRPFHKKILKWDIHLLLSLIRLVKYAVYPPKKYGRVIYFNWNKAYIRQLFLIRKNYPEIRKKIASLKDIGNNNLKPVPQASALSVQDENSG